MESCSYYKTFDIFITSYEEFCILSLLATNQQKEITKEQESKDIVISFGHSVKGWSRGKPKTPDEILPVSETEEGLGKQRI